VLEGVWIGYFPSTAKAEYHLVAYGQLVLEGIWISYFPSAAKAE
jgi:hypothetical protein